MIWVWYGLCLDEAALPALPWDEELDTEFAAKPARTVVSSDIFDVSYLRLLENSTDLFHVPFVHRAVVPPWKQVEDFECKTEGTHVRVQGRLTNGKPDQKGFYAAMHYVAPAHLLMILGHKGKARFIASFAPVDDTHMWVCAQYTQDYIRLPLAGRFASWLLCLLDYRLLQLFQDAPIWRSQQPENPKEIDDYLLIAADRGVAEIFRIRRELINEASLRRKQDKMEPPDNANLRSIQNIK